MKYTDFDTSKPITLEWNEVSITTATTLCMGVLVGSGGLAPSPVCVPCTGYSVAVVEAEQVSAAWGTAVLTLKRSVAFPGNAYALETAETLGPGNDISRSINLYGVPYLSVWCTTAEGATEYVTVRITLR